MGVGFADLASGRRPDATTLFRIASITKTFTGTAVMQLCAAGRLGLDDPAVEYLPELSRAQGKFGPISTVTIRRLLSHESGLAGDPTRDGLRGPGLRGTGRAYPRPGRRDSHGGTAALPGQVLQPRLPAAGRDRRPRQRGTVPSLCGGKGPGAAGNVGYRLRPSPGLPPEPEGRGLQPEGLLRLPRACSPGTSDLGRRRVVVIGRGHGRLGRVPAGGLRPRQW